MARLRADLWVSAYVRRQNDVGHMCVVSRRGDPVAGQIWVSVDHLDGTHSLYVPASSASRSSDDQSHLFEIRYDRQPADKVNDRIALEGEFDPDLWVVSLDLRAGDPNLDFAKAG